MQGVSHQEGIVITSYSIHYTKLYEAYGVKGITLEEGNEVIGMETIKPDSTTAILTVTEGGYGKRTPVNEYRIQGRGGKGIISVKT